MQKRHLCRVRWLSVIGARFVLLFALFVVARGKGNPGRQLEQRPTEPSTISTWQGRITPPSNSSEGGGNILLPDLLPLGVPLLRAADNPQPSADACCDSCRHLEGCNVVFFCSPEQVADCHNEFHNITLPPGGCELVSQALSGPDTGRPLVAVYAEGFTGGAPIEFTAPEIDGYTSFYGVSLWYRYDMTCPPGLTNVALPTSCGVVGDPTELAGACNADDRCQAMSYFPFGRDYQEDPVVLFKGGTGAALNLSEATLNQNTVLYVKNAPAAVAVAAGGGGGLSGAAIAGIVVGTCCGMAVVAAVVVLLARHHRRQQQLAAGTPSGGKFSACCHEAPSNGAGHIGPDCQAKDCLELEEGEGLPCEAHKAEHASSMSSNGLAGEYPKPGAHSNNNHNSNPPTPPPSVATLSTRASGKGGAVALPRSSASLAHSAAGSVASSRELPPGAAAAMALDRLGSWGELAPLPENAASWQSSIEFCRNADGDHVQLGSGAFATVYRVLLDGVQPYAAKVIPLHGNARVQAAFLKESGTLRQLRHRNIVQFAGAYITDDGDGVILMELMEGGDLHTRLLSQTKSGERLFAWGHRGKTVALDVARALHYLHGLKLTHFDIKTRNVLLTRDITAKVADVGFTRPMHNTHHSLSDGRTGTFDYMAPELLLGRKCNESVDIYSYGVLLWEVCTGDYPVRGCLRPLAVPEECPEEVAALVLECMDEDPAQRPTARDLVQRLQRLQHLQR